MKSAGVILLTACIVTMSYGTVLPEMGVKFILQQQTINLDNGFANLILHAQLPALDHISPPVCRSNILNCTNIDKLIIQAYHKLSASQDQLRVIAEEFRPKTNRKRGLLNFVGTSANYLFGMATTKDIQQVYLQCRYIENEYLHHPSSRQDQQMRNILIRHCGTVRMTPQ